VAAGDADGRVVVWDVATGDESARLARQDAPVRCLRWTSRCDRLAVCLGDWTDREHAALLVWSPDESIVIDRHSLAEPSGAIDWLAGDRSLIVAMWDGRAQIVSAETGEPTSELDLGKDGKDLVSAAAWSPDCPLVPRWLAERLLAGAP
jgi:WD40 repeat protein